jgi:two-component sensor histidine kinase
MPLMKLQVATSSVGAARRLLRQVLGAGLFAVDDATVDTAELITSELVTNAVRYARHRLDVAIDVSADRLRVGVSDDSVAMPTLGRPDLESPSGRGLLIVEALSDRWGVDAVVGGKIIWFELALRLSPPSQAMGLE